MAIAPITGFDSFTRTPSGTGKLDSSDSGAVWKDLTANTATSDSRLAVSTAGYVRISTASAFSYKAQFLNTGSDTDGIVQMRVRFNSYNDNQFCGVCLRANTSSERFTGARIAAISSDGSVLLSIVDIGSDKVMYQRASKARYDLSKGTWCWLKYQITSGGSYRMKAWADGTAEPSAWDLSISADTITPTSAGYAGFFYGLSVSSATTLTTDIETFYYWNGSQANASIDADPIYAGWTKDCDPGLGYTESGHLWYGSFADDPDAYASSKLGSVNTSNTTGTLYAPNLSTRYGFIGPSESNYVISASVKLRDPDLWFGLGGRGTATFGSGYASTSGGYALRLGVTKADIVETPAMTVLDSYTYPFTVTVDSTYISGRLFLNGTKISAKVWKRGTAEPGSYQLEATDSTTASGVPFIYLQSTVSGSHDAALDPFVVGIWSAVTANIVDINSSVTASAKRRLQGASAQSVSGTLTAGLSTIFKPSSSTLTGALSVATVTPTVIYRPTANTVTGASSVAATARAFARDAETATSNVVLATIPARLRTIPNSAISALVVDQPYVYVSRENYLVPPPIVTTFAVSAPDWTFIAPLVGSSSVQAELGSFATPTGVTSSVAVAEIKPRTLIGDYGLTLSTAINSASTVNTVLATGTFRGVPTGSLASTGAVSDVGVVSIPIPAEITDEVTFSQIANKVTYRGNGGVSGSGSLDASGGIIRNITSSWTDFNAVTTVSLTDMVRIPPPPKARLVAESVMQAGADSENLEADGLKMLTFTSNSLIKAAHLNENFARVLNAVGDGTTRSSLTINKYLVLGPAMSASFSALSDADTDFGVPGYLHLGYGVQQAKAALSITLKQTKATERDVFALHVTENGPVWYWGEGREQDGIAQRLKKVMRVRTDNAIYLAESAALHEGKALEVVTTPTKQNEQHEDPEPPPPSWGFAVGSTCKVIADPDLRIRTGPGLGYDTIIGAKYGSYLTITGKPTSRDDWTWYPVKWSSSWGTVYTGYSAGEYLVFVSAPPPPVKQPDPTPTMPAPTASAVTHYRMMFQPWTDPVTLTARTNFRSTSGHRLNLPASCDNARAIEVLAVLDTVRTVGAKVILRGVDQHEVSGLHCHPERQAKEAIRATVPLGSERAVLLFSDNTLDSVTIEIVGIWL